MDKSVFFKKELETIKSEDIRHFAEYLRDNAPDYLYTVAASTTSQYHPLSELGLGGLYRHSMNVTRVLNYLIGIEQYRSKLSDRQRDLMRVAMMFHDAVKLGWNGSQYTVANHPLLAAEWVKNMNNEYDSPIAEEEVEFIADCISSHSGEWNVNKKGEAILPKPVTLAQELCHLADYIGSRRDIEIIHDKDEVTKPVFTSDEIDSYEFTFGKYKGMTFSDVKKEDPDYIKWLYNTRYDINAKFRCPEPLATFCEDFVIY